MLGSFTARLEWLERVARDPDCRGLPLRVACLLTTRYINSKSGRAWPAVTTLAKLLTANRRSVQRALDTLIEAGHLRRERSTGRSNSYWMKHRGSGLRTAPAEAEGRSTDRRGGGLHAARGAVPTPPYPGSNPGKERGEPTPAASHRPVQPAGNQTKSNQTKRSNTPLPQDWQPGPAEFNIADSYAGWDPERATTEFGQFIAWQRARAGRSHDWLATWELWCRKGKSFDDNDDKKATSFRGSRGALRGLQAWVARQEKKLDS